MENVISNSVVDEVTMHCGLTVCDSVNPGNFRITLPARGGGALVVYLAATFSDFDLIRASFTTPSS